MPPPAPTPSTPPPPPKPEDGEKDSQELHESPYTLPNALTVARIIACPFLGYSIVKGDFAMATGILAVSGFTDWLDGYLARKWNQKSVLGSVIDPMADKMLMTTLVVALTYEGLLPRECRCSAGKAWRCQLTAVPLAVLIFGRDLALSLWAFYLRYKSLPPPKTWSRYWDPSMPSAEVRPTQISKVNTALQLVLMGVTTVSPLLTVDIGPALQGLQLIVATTTIWSGLSYVGNSGFKILKQPLKDSIKETLKKRAPPKP